MMGGARLFICSPVVLISRPCVRHCGVSSQNKGSVVIPSRIERGPTDILKALSLTVGVDHTAYHYKYPDDPYFYPNSEVKKKVLALSLESGRKSARWIFNNNPGFFKNQLSEPPIEEFFVKPVISGVSKPTEETLLNAIEKRNVLKAIEVYQALEKENQNVSESTKQCLLELTCFYNCEERPSQDLEEKWFFDQKQEKENISIWMHQGFAEKLFEKMDSSCSLANSAIIQGMLKYDEIFSAQKIFEEARMKKVKLSVGVYNMFLSKIPEEATGRNVIVHVEKILNEMFKEKVMPNLGTLNAILKLLLFSQEYSKINFTLEVMKQFEIVGIKPSLGSYGYLLLILSNLPSREKTYHSLSCEIMTHIENKKFKILHPSDFEFFKNASTAFSYYYGDPDLSLRLLDMYFRNNNSKFFISFFEERSFFKDIFPIIFKEKPVEISVDVYRRYFFNIFDPTVKVFKALMSAIDKNHASSYLTEIWKDLEEFNLHKTLTFLTIILNLVENFSDEASVKLFHSVANTYFSLIENENFDWFNANPVVFSNMLIAFVKNDDEPKVLRLLKILKNRRAINLSQRFIEVLFNYVLSKQNIPVLLESLRMADEAKLPTVSEMARKSLPLLEDDLKAWATELMNKEKEEDKSKFK